MNMTFRSEQQSEKGTRHLRIVPKTLAIRSLIAVTAFSSLLGLTGCGMSGGRLLYAMGLGRSPKIEAQFKLTTGPIMIFIDDMHERMDWPATERHIFEELSQELLRNKAASKIIPLETIDYLRQSMDDFNKRGAREIGERAGAEQVLWLEVRDFLADEQIVTAQQAAYLAVSVRVINVHETESRSRVRLWPTNPEGHLVSTGLSGAHVAEVKTKDAIARKLAEKLGKKVARLFYTHRADETDAPDW
jgi:hypothetical protein